MKVGLDNVFQIPVTIDPEKSRFSGEGQKTMIFSSLLQKSAEPDFFWEIGLSQFRASIVKKLCAKNKENR